MTGKKSKVLVAMSGGIDSSYAAFLLLKEGYEVVGVFMKVGKNYSDAFQVAKSVSDYLGIKLYGINVNHVFRKEVIDYFVSGYEKGLTPNPCVKCNKTIKFGELFKLTKGIGCDYLATGHYVKLKKDKDTYSVYKGEDRRKDQTYFLYNLKQEQLPYLIFPLSDLVKEDIIKKAKQEKIPFQPGESQDICFLDGDHNIYLKGKIRIKTGQIRNNDEKVLGKHIGLPFYTVGQRKGIELGGDGPYYVLRKDFKNNVLYVTTDRDDKLLYSDCFFVSSINWINPKEIKLPMSTEVVFRYRHKNIDCNLQEFGGKIKVILSEPQRAITEGQSAVFYDNDKLLGGGVIGF